MAEPGGPLELGNALKCLSVEANKLYVGSPAPARTLPALDTANER